jgi:hypothetical protein
MSNTPTSLDFEIETCVRSHDNWHNAPNICTTSNRYYAGMQYVSTVQSNHAHAWSHDMNWHWAFKAPPKNGIRVNIASGFTHLRRDAFRLAEEAAALYFSLNDVEKQFASILIRQKMG